MTFYSVSFAGVAVVAQQDLFEITGAADSLTIIHQVVVSQSTEVGDAQEEGLSLLFKRGATTTGSGGTTPTPAPLEFGSVAYGGVTKVNNTTKASVGTIVTMHAENWNVRGPYLYLPTPELRMTLSPSQRFTVELGTTPIDSITMSGVVYLEELG